MEFTLSINGNAGTALIRLFKNREPPFPPNALDSTGLRGSEEPDILLYAKLCIAAL
jgi:hypothetical protein